MTATPDKAPETVQALKEAAAEIAAGLDEYMMPGGSTASTYLTAIIDLLEVSEQHLDAAGPEGGEETETHRVHRDLAAAYAQLGKAAARAIALRIETPSD